MEREYAKHTVKQPFMASQFDKKPILAVGLDWQYLSKMKQDERYTVVVNGVEYSQTVHVLIDIAKKFPPPTYSRHPRIPFISNRSVLIVPLRDLEKGNAV